MRRTDLFVAALAAITSAPGLVANAFAHGGTYRGPAGEIPEKSRDPHDPPPPPDGGGPQTPGNDNPVTATYAAKNIAAVLSVLAA